MSFAQGSRTGLSYVVETTFGVTPDTPSMVAVPFNTHSLSLKKDAIESAEIRSDRQVAVFRHGNKQINGDIEVEFRADDYDDFLESAFMGEIDSFGILKVGTTPKYLTIEDSALDIVQYRRFTGCAVNTLSMTIKPNEIVKMQMGIIGKDMTTAQLPLDSSITDASGQDPFDSFSGTILEGGVSLANVSSLEFTIENGMAPTFVIGSDVTPQLEFGRAKVSGTMQAYFENLNLLNKFINETPSTLEFSLTDGVSGNTYTFLFPNIKYSGGDLPVQNEQSKMISLPFVALLDSTEETNLKLTIGN